EVDIHLMGEGRHHRLWDVLGAHRREHQGVWGTAFAVWAPAARSVRVVGDFNGWDGRVHPMRSLGSSGVWELFVPDVEAGPRYKRDMGFTHVELMPVAEHPFGGSWGYQVSSYYAPTGRYGSPDGLKALVDALHGAGIGVVVDWVPAHFPRDDWALARFDGSA